MCWYKEKSYSCGHREWGPCLLACNLVLRCRVRRKQLEESVHERCRPCGVIENLGKRIKTKQREIDWITRSQNMERSMQVQTIMKIQRDISELERERMELESQLAGAMDGSKILPRVQDNAWDAKLVGDFGNRECYEYRKQWYSRNRLIEMSNTGNERNSQTTGSLGLGMISDLMIQSPNLTTMLATFVSWFTDTLINDLPSSTSLSYASVRGMFIVLPSCLDVFGNQIESQSSHQDFREIMIFFKRNVSEISASCLAKYEKRYGTMFYGPYNHDMLYKHYGVEEVNHWLEYVQNVAESNVNSESQGSGPNAHYVNTVFRPMIESTGYDFLIADLKRGFFCPSREYPMESIENEIMSRVPSRRGPAGLPRVILKIDWSPLAFLKEQKHTSSPEVSIENIITLTGHKSEALALTCGQYLSQTWGTAASGIIPFINGLIQDETKLKHTCRLANGTLLAGWIENNNLIVGILGIAGMVVEVFQQLVWLGAALGSSAHEHEIVHCTTRVKRPVIIVNRFDISIHFAVNYDKQRLDSPGNKSHGDCWLGLFKNPVLVGGFPIPRRSEADTGLEIPLDLMASLTQAPRLTVFDGKLFIKGFSSMLIPTKHTQDLVIWHLIFNKDHERISYTDSRIVSMSGLYPATLDATGLKAARHIVGWCSSATEITGSPQANYDIGWSGLPKANEEGCYFAQKSIMRGNFIQPQSEALILPKDKASYLASDVYVAQLRWIARQCVVLYDVQEKRAWLVDGASALLHLVRASLREDENDDLSDLLQFQTLKLEEASNEITAKRAAVAVLVNKRNRGLELYVQSHHEERHTPAGAATRENIQSRPRKFVLQDRVDQIYHLLEQIIDHQVCVNVEKSNNMLDDNQTQLLEGFNFMDVVTDEDHIWPRVTKLQSTGANWLGLTTAIHAITLFGRGFGDLIQPTNLDMLCPRWFTVPKAKDYLCVCVTHIALIMKKRGNMGTRPWSIVEGILWHTADKTFEKCSCDAGSAGECNRVQVPVPSNGRGLRCMDFRSPERLEKQGAIILGGDLVSTPRQDQKQSRSSSPQKSDLGRIRSTSTDSGLGSSIETAISEDRNNRDPSLQKDSEFRADIACVFPSSNSWRTSLPASTGKVPFLDRYSRANDVPQSFISNQTLQLGCDLPKSSSKTPGEATYTVGLICALRIELQAALKILDEYYERGFGHGSDKNLYILGRIRDCNVVIVCLPMGRYGNNTAAMVATRMMAKYPRITVGLMVGIGGGLPSEENDIRLGDVIVSKPCSRHGGVVQYDMGKHRSDGFECSGWLNAPPESLLAVLNIMPPHGVNLGSSFSTPYPGESLDTLYNPAYPHVGGESCVNCDPHQIMPRDSGDREAGPRVFYGTIASGNAVIKDAATRNDLKQQHGALCFEMEAAGLISSNFPCLVIRGVSDYADSHKNDLWQEYAAMAAAQYAKDLICTIPGFI